LIGSLGRLGRHMAALPEVAEDPSVAEAGAVSTPKVEEDVQMGGVPQEQKPGGGKKKKKGKK